MTMNESSSPRSSLRSLLQKAWDLFTAPSASVTDVGERRVARLAASSLFVIAVLAFLGGLARIGIGRTPVEAFTGGIGFTLLPTLIAYLVSRTKWYRVAIFFFSVAYSAIAYGSYLAEGAQADIALLVLIYVPLGLIIASTFLSWQAVFLLMGLNVGALIATRYFGAPVPEELGTLAAMITLIGLVLIILSYFRASTERYRIAQIQDTNRKLEDLTINLEKRVELRTIELENATEQTSRRAKQLQTITELSEAISQFQDPSEIFPAATRLISERFGFYHVGIFLIDSGREHAILQAANSEGGQRMLARGHRLRLGTGVVGYAAQTGQPRIALDVGVDAVFFDNPDLPETRSEVALPLKARSATIGVLDVQSLEAGAFTTEDLQVLTALANQVSIALENARLLAETRAALEQVQDVYNEFTRAEWSRTVLQAEQYGFRYHAGRIELMEDRLQAPEVTSAVQKGEAVALAAEASREKRSSMAVPVKLRGEVIGVLHVEAGDADKTWQEDEIRLVEAVAERAAFAMENARLFQDARRRAAKESLISEASARISGALNIENILHATAEELERVLGGAEVLIQFQDKEAA